MKLIYPCMAIMVAIACNGNKEQQTGSPKPAYILKPDSGIVLGADSGMIVKAAPGMGSANDIAIVQKIKPGKGTGLHYHTDADEIFFIMEGTGNVTLGNKSYDITAGDFIFIPKNSDHKIRKYDSTGILKVVFFMDKPGLLEFFKERHKQFYIDKKPMTLGELNKVAEKYNTHFKTLN